MNMHQLKQAQKLFFKMLYCDIKKRIHEVEILNYCMTMTSSFILSQLDFLE